MSGYLTPGGNGEERVGSGHSQTVEKRGGGKLSLISVSAETPSLTRVHGGGLGRKGLASSPSMFIYTREKSARARHDLIGIQWVTGGGRQKFGTTKRMEKKGRSLTSSVSQPL